MYKRQPEHAVKLFIRFALAKAGITYGMELMLALFNICLLYTSGIQAYHGYLSFKENEVTPEQAQQIGMEFATKMWGKRFQVVVTTHLNLSLIHI